MKSRSLFWTFAGVFLLVLAVATALQIFVSVGVLRPLAQQNARQQAELRVEQVSREIAALPYVSEPRDIIPVLRAENPEGRPEILVFCMHDGPVVPACGPARFPCGRWIGWTNSHRCRLTHRG